MVLIQLTVACVNNQFGTILINTDRIDGIVSMDNGSGASVYVGGAEQPFIVTNSYDEIVNILSNCGHNVIRNDDEHIEAVREFKFNKFIDVVKQTRGANISNVNVNKGENNE